MANKKYLDLDALKVYHSKLKPIIESKANSSDVYNKNDVYNKSEVDSALDSKSEVGHTHDQYVTEQNVYTKEQVDAALESKSDISHTHDQYLTDIGIDISFDGSDTLKGTATDYKILGVDSTKTYYLSGTKFIGTGCTNITITPIIGTSATCTYDEKTGIVSWTIYGTSSSGPVSANLSWTGSSGILTSTKDGTKTTVGYFNTINGESIVSTTESKDFDIYTKTEVDNKLSSKSDKADTLAGYGITDAYTKNEVDNKLSSKSDTGHTHGNITKDGLLATADQVVVTDANKKITSVAKGTAFNKDFGTTAGTVSEGNHTHDDMYVKGPSSATNNNIAIFDGETGKLIKTSTASIDNQTLSIHTRLSFRDRENPSIEMMSSGKNFYLQSFQGKICLGSTLNTSTYWDDNGVARFQALPNVKGKNVSLEGHTHTASEITDFPTIPTKTSELTNDSGYLTSHQSLENYATKSDLANYLPLSGGTLTGNLSGKYITGTWLQTTAASDLGSAPPKYGVISSGGWLYTRTLAETKTDLGIPTKVSQLDNDSGYINDVKITSSSSGSKLVSGTTGTIADDIGSGPRYQATGTINIGLGATDITITPLDATEAKGSYDPSTGDYSWTLYADTEKATVTGTIKWSSGDDQLKITKNGSENVVGYFNKINGQSIVALDSPKDFSFYTKTEVDSALNTKANASDVYSKSDVDTKLSGKATKATTLSGYGITNAYTKTETDNLINSITKTVVFDTYNKFIEFLEDTSQATYDYFNIGDSIYIKEEGSDYWISGKEDIVEDGYRYRNIIGHTGNQILGTDNIYRTTVTENIGTTYTSVTVDGIKPSDGSCNYSNFSWNSSTGVVKITLESIQPSKTVTVTLKCHVPASGGGDYGYYYISNIGPIIPTVGDGMLILQKNGVQQGTFKANATTNTTLNITVPTKTSELTNDSGYLTKVESVIDYGDTNKTIKIGYSGAGLTASQIGYIAGYTNGANNNEHKIKDISKDVLKSWLGYAEVTTGILGPNTDVPDITNSSYFWIVYPNSPSSSSMSFLAESSSYNAYQFAFIQGGTPGSIRYFKSTTTLGLVQTTSIFFRAPMNYIKFKIG